MRGYFYYETSDLMQQDKKHYERSAHRDAIRRVADRCRQVYHCGSGRRPSHRHIYLNKHTHTHTHTHPSLCHDTPTPPFAQRGPRLGADSPPAVREMPVSPAALQRGGGRKEGREDEMGRRGRMQRWGTVSDG